MIRKTLLLLPLLFFTVGSFAQYYLSGQDPASIRWQQMETTYFRLIFPKGHFEQARQLAFLTDHSYPLINQGLNARKIKSDLLLHTSSAISNATVAWAPRRLDFFHTPPQDGYSQEWFRQLSTHELRHIAQINSLNNGFGKALSLVFGQQGTAAVLGVFIPNWFLEGDAVVSETVHSNSGRGRQSLFEAGLRTQFLERGIFSYDKAYFGSYRHHVPDIYELGYYFVGYQRHKHGEHLWRNMLETTAKQPYRLNPFSHALRQTTGKNKNQLYLETMNELTSFWKEQDQKNEITPVVKHSPDKKFYTNYLFPQLLSDGSVVAIRTAINDIARIVLIDQKQEKILFTPGSIFVQSLSATDSLVAWNEYQSDPRWSNRSFSVIKLGNLQSGKIQQISHRSSLFAPDLTDDGSKLVASETNHDGRHALVIMDTETGQVIQRIESDSLFFQTPKWFNDHLHVAAVAVGKMGKAIFKINTLTTEMTLLADFSYDDFALSSVMGDQLLLHGSWTGISNIFILNPTNRQISQLTSSRFGAAHAVPGMHGQIVFSSYRAQGWEIAQASLADAPETSTGKIKNTSYPLADLLSEGNEFNIDELEITDTSFLVKPYSKFRNLFHFHSWSPVFISTDNQNFGPGVSLFSQNTLSTMVTELGYSYDLNQQTGTMEAKISYYGWYPVVSFGFNSGNRRDETMLENQLYQLKWWENDWNINLSMPLNFTRSKWVRGIRPAAGFRQIHRKMDEDVGLQFKHNLTSSVSYDFFAYQYMRMSKRDLVPKAGLLIQAIFRHSPFDEEPSRQYYAGATAFLPGFAPHHGFRFNMAWQLEQRGYYSYGSLIPSPRGYDNLFFREATGLKADYLFPIAYPELNWPTVAYFKRLRGNFYYDLVNGRNASNEWANYSSAGFEALSDWHFFNFPAPVTLGFRLSYGMTDQNFIPEFIWGINFDAIQ